MSNINNVLFLDVVTNDDENFDDIFLVDGLTDEDGAPVMPTSSRTLEKNKAM